jgi:hypothetical protein
MKLMKYVIALAVAFCVTANVSRAQGTIQYLGSGSSAIFLELGQGAATLADTTDGTGAHCYWTHGKDANVTARDDRPSIPAGVANTDEQGNIWIAWGGGTGTCAAPVAPFNVYAEMNLDSVIGQRCFFATSAGGSGCLFNFTVAALTAGNPTTTVSNACPATPCSLLGPRTSYIDTPIPANVISTLNAARFMAAATDIRPEDGKFASARMFVACGTPFTRNPYIQTSYQTYGLGFQTATPGIGVNIASFTNPGSVFHVYDFNITGNDPLSGLALGARASYSVSTVGAQPIIVVVSPNDGALNRLASANDIMFSTLGEFFFGGYGRTSDLTGDLVDPDRPVTVLLREPLSGTYNVFEYSTVNSNQFKTSQDINNCTGANVNSNPLHIASANGGIAGSFRERALGTGQVVAALKAPAQDTMGYFFWSAGNADGFTTNAKYLTVNGIDPLKNTYTDGILPGVDAGHPITDVTFKSLAAGDYAIWSAVRIVSTSPTPAGVTALIAGATASSAATADFIPVSALKIWKSHFNMFAIGVTNNNNGNTVATPNDLCPGSTGEGGGDAGAMTISIHGNNNFCTDFVSPIGINDKNQ